MDDFEFAVKMFFLGFLFSMLLLMIILSIVLPDSYKQGQIDYANGKIEYCLQTNKQNEKVWEHCKEE